MQPDWYIEKRKHIQEVFAQSKPQDTKEVFSPSEKYKLIISDYFSGKNTWNYTRGDVINVNDGQLISRVDRNYTAFPFSWCERHPEGHDYLICGEDYQCQTIIELDTRKRIDYVDPLAEQGWAFCWTAHYPSPDGKYLIVEGCVWACPYELVLFDFTKPMSLPYKEIKRWPKDESYTQDLDKVLGFNPDGSFAFTFEEEVRRLDNKPVRLLTKEEQEILSEAENYNDVIRYRKYKTIWQPDNTEQIISMD